MRFSLMVAAAAVSVSLLSAQSGAPPVIEITREMVKEGKTYAHRKVEQEYANAFRKNKFPFTYIALASSSGPNEVWFISSYPSFAALEQNDAESEKEPMKSALAAIEPRDGELRASSHRTIAVFRPDLSYIAENPLPIAKTRYVMIETFRVRLGKDAEWESMAKNVTGAMRKAKFSMSGYAYQPVVGAPAGTILILSPMASLKEMDGEPERMKAMVEAMGAGEFDRLMKSQGEVFQSQEAALFSVSPEMSYAGKEIEDVDPAFWRPKPAITAAPKPKEQKGQ